MAERDREMVKQRGSEGEPETETDLQREGERQRERSGNPAVQGHKQGLLAGVRMAAGESANGPGLGGGQRETTSRDPGGEQSCCQDGLPGREWEARRGRSAARPGLAQRQQRTQGLLMLAQTGTLGQRACGL